MDCLHTKALQPLGQYLEVGHTKLDLDLEVTLTFKVKM